jgi:hypothetical protein
LILLGPEVLSLPCGVVGNIRKMNQKKRSVETEKDIYKDNKEKIKDIRMG